LKEEGITTFGATGYCFGGRYSVDLAIENVTKVIVISHPSMLQVPEDFEVCGNVFIRS
jgi:dienelactone hydrolase